MLGIVRKPEGNAITAVPLINCVVTKCVCEMSVTVKYIKCQKAFDVRDLRVQEGKKNN